MPSVIFALSIGIATINDMQRSMSGVLMTRAISLRSRMRGNLSCPVLKAGRRERSLLPSYQIVQSKMTKTNLLTALRGGDHVADLHLISRDNDPINQQLNHL